MESHITHGIAFSMSKMRGCHPVHALIKHEGKDQNHANCVLSKEKTGALSYEWIIFIKHHKSKIIPTSISPRIKVNYSMDTNKDQQHESSRITFPFFEQVSCQTLNISLPTRERPNKPFTNFSLF